MTERLITPQDVSPEVMEARNRVNGYSPERIAELMNLSEFERTEHSTDRVVEFGLLENGDEIDESRLHVMPFPYGNGYAPHMLMRAMMLQKSVDTNHPVLMLSNPAFRHQPFDLDADERRTVASGDFTPIVDRHRRVIDYVSHRYKTDVECIIDGYSQGASIGARLAGKVATIGAFLAEAPNTTTRGSGEAKEETKLLSKAFQNGGISPLNRSIHDSRLTGLNEAQGISPKGKIAAGQLLGLAKVGISTLKGENKALKSGLAVPNFSEDLLESTQERPEMQLMIARAVGSLILTEDQQAQVMRELDGLSAAEYVALDSNNGEEPYGHAAGDNLLLHAEAYRQLYNKATLQ